MTLEQLSKMLAAYCLVLPGVKDQMIFNISIDVDAFLRISLEETKLEIPLA